MICVRFALSLRYVEDLLAERGYWTLRWHVAEVFVKISGETHYLWRAPDHEGEVIESYVTKKRDKYAALRFFRKVLENNRA